MGLAHTKLYLVETPICLLLLATSWLHLRGKQPQRLSLHTSMPDMLPERILLRLNGLRELGLLRNTRNDDALYKSGDKVYYKRPDEKEWKGPGVVIGVEVVVKFVRHGRSLVRFHRCRLQKVSSIDKLRSNDYSGNLEVLSLPKPATHRVENTSNDSCKVISETHVEPKSETNKSEGCKKSLRLVKKPDWLNDYVEDVDEVMLVNDIDMNDAKMKELESWRENKVYHEVPHQIKNVFHLGGCIHSQSRHGLETRRTSKRL